LVFSFKIVLLVQLKNNNGKAGKSKNDYGFQKKFKTGNK